MEADVGAACRELGIQNGAAQREPRQV